MVTAPLKVRNLFGEYETECSQIRQAGAVLASLRIVKDELEHFPMSSASSYSKK
jgi:hypothetical protein